MDSSLINLSREKFRCKPDSWLSRPFLVDTYRGSLFLRSVFLAFGIHGVSSRKFTYFLREHGLCLPQSSLVSSTPLLWSVTSWLCLSISSTILTPIKVILVFGYLRTVDVLLHQTKCKWFPIRPMVHPFSDVPSVLTFVPGKGPSPDPFSGVYVTLITLRSLYSLSSGLGTRTTLQSTPFKPQTCSLI